MSLTKWSRLVRYRNVDGSIKYGEPILDPKSNEDIASLARAGQLRVHVCDGNNALEASRTDAIEEAKELLGPLASAEVPIVRCIGLNYKTHILETGRPLPTCPTIFMKPSPSVADHDQAIQIPYMAQNQVDYEGELVVLIGKDAKDVSEANALEYVAGYTVGNDITARDWQRDKDKAGPVPQWTFGKSFDQFAPLGPCLVSAAVIGEADKQELRTIVNGQERQRGNTSDLCFGVNKLIAFCSQGQTLQKGSLIMTGTPGGVGMFMDPATFLQNGDVVEVDIQGIGRLRNTIRF